MKDFLKIIVCLSLIFVAKTSFIDTSLKPEFLGAGIIGILYVLTDWIVYLEKNWSRFLLILKCWYLSWSNQYIRFSMSYQYIIKVQDKYLLVKNSNWNFYQHVGGKYKRFPQTQAILNKFDAQDDPKLSTSGLKKDDFAIYIPAKNAISFLDWFKAGEDREISHWREFQEELLDGEKGNILSKENFAFVNYVKIDSVRTPVKKSTVFKCWEILQYDVLVLIPAHSQEIELKELLKKGDTKDYKWADLELINNDGFNVHSKKTEYKIGEHTKWVINRSWSET